MRWDTKRYRERLHHRLKQLRAVKTWQLVILLLISVLVSATLLRLNSLTMAELRRAVIAADEKGDEATIQKTVNALGVYVGAHMNTDLQGGFYLSASYERARQAAVQAASDTSDPSSKLYQQASVQCQTERLQVAGGYVQCVLNKVSELGGPSTLQSELTLPRSEGYKVNFVSPLWSYDLAGLGVAISVIIVLVIVARITGVIILRALLKRRFQSIS